MYRGGKEFIFTRCHMKYKRLSSIIKRITTLLLYCKPPNLLAISNYRVIIQKFTLLEKIH